MWEIPLISVILCTYNWGWNLRFLKQSIESVLCQTFKNFEFIIINDFSTDKNVEKVILEYKENDNRIIYLSNNTNLKQAKSRNKWMKIARWKYISFIDDDDIRVDKNKLEKQLNYMENNKDVWICWTFWNIINMKNEIVIKETCRYRDEDIRWTILQSNQFCTSSVMIINSNNYRFDEKFVWYSEDYELWCRIGIKYKFHNINSYCVNYRSNENWTVNNYRMRMWRNEYRVFFRYFFKYPNNYRALILRIGASILPNSMLSFFIHKFKN